MNDQQIEQFDHMYFNSQNEKKPFYSANKPGQSILV